MKKLMVVIAVICFFYIPAYAADDCDSEYSNLIKELEKSNILETEKKKYLPGLKRALIRRQ
jgi:hypothetical protein